MTQKMSLPAAIHLANTPATDIACACSLHGLPVGGWPETVQARARLLDALPLRSQRTFGLEQLIGAMYDLESHDNAADVYRLREVA